MIYRIFGTSSESARLNIALRTREALNKEYFIITNHWVHSRRALGSCAKIEIKPRSRSGVKNEITRIIKNQSLRKTDFYVCGCEQRMCVNKITRFIQKITYPPKNLFNPEIHSLVHNYYYNDKTSSKFSSPIPVRLVLTS